MARRAEEVRGSPALHDQAVPIAEALRTTAATLMQLGMIVVTPAQQPADEAACSIFEKGPPC